MKILSTYNTTYCKQYQSSRKEVSTNKFNYSCSDSFQLRFGHSLPSNTKEITHGMYLSAQEYLKAVKANNTDSIDLGIACLDMDKLNGIQKGIKVFNGLSMKEIYTIFDKLSIIMPKRGCSNRCSHCAPEAIPQHFSKDSDMIDSMLWEDFEELLSGYHKLSKRTGVDFLPQNEEMSLFYDADCIELEMKDKNGKIYDFADANGLLFDKTKCRGLFDTSGWNPKSERLQKRAEKIVNYLNQNKYRMNPINISVNPFHVLLEKSNECRNAKDIKAADFFRDLYTGRMANAIYTFTPIIDEINFIFRIKSNDRFHSQNELMSLKDEILYKLEKMYKKDFLSEKKYIKTEDQLEETMYKVKVGFNKEGAEIGNLGRAGKFFSGTSDKSLWNELSDKQIFLGELKRGIYETMIDANGRIYLTNGYLTAPTKMQLNFANRNKKTMPPQKLLNEESVNVANNIIDKFILEAS